MLLQKRARVGGLPGWGAQTLLLAPLEARPGWLREAGRWLRMKPGAGAGAPTWPARSVELADFFGLTSGFGTRLANSSAYSTPHRAT